MPFELTDEPDAADQWNAYVLGLERDMAIAICAFLDDFKQGPNWETVRESRKHYQPLEYGFRGLLFLLKYTDSHGYRRATGFDGLKAKWIQVTEPNWFEITGLIYIVDGYLAPFAVWFQLGDDAQSFIDYEIRFWDDRVVKMRSYRKMKRFVYLGQPGGIPAQWKLKYRLLKQDVVAANLFPARPSSGGSQLAGQESEPTVE